MKRKALSVMLTMMLAMLTTTVFAQGTLKGTVIDEDAREGMIGANVAVDLKNGSGVTTGATTDLDGNFKVEGLKYGSYTATVSCIGYKTVKRDFTVSKENPVVTLKTIAMAEDSKMLGEVEVTGIRSQMKFEIDKKVFNVDQAIAAAGGSASELLENIPSVEVDNEGTVSLRGSENVTVWINGKAQGLNGDNQGSILEQLPAESIERIEVITNPSAKYSPDGTVGIINIVLKRDRKPGYYGSVQAGTSIMQNGDEGYIWGGGRGGANINYSSGLLDAYAQLNYRGHRNVGSNGSYREEFPEGSETSYLDQTGRNFSKGSNFFGRAGVTWHPTEKDDISLDLMGMQGSHKHDNSIDYTSRWGKRDEQGALIFDRNRTTGGNDGNQMYNIQAGYKHLWSTEHFIDFTLSRNQWTSDNLDIFDQNTHFPTGSDVISHQEQKQNINNHSYEAQIDYENKLTANSKIEAGYKGNFNFENSPISTFDGVKNPVENYDLYNRFIYNSRNHAFYGTYSNKLWQKLGYQVGFRGEWYKVNAQSESKNAAGEFVMGEPITKNIFHIYPSAFLSYELPNDNELQLNYTNRVRRPWGGMLNSFKNITDSTNISFGNPDLNPEYSQSFELNYMKTWENHVLSVSSYYRHSDDIMQHISYMDGGIMYSTHVNVAASNSAGVEIVAKDRFWNCLDLTTTLNGYYYQQQGFAYQYQNHENGNTYDVTGDPTSSFSWNARMIASVTLPHSWSGQLTGMYHSGRANAQGYSKAGYGVDCGIRKQFMDNKWSIALNARDLLDSRAWRNVTFGDDFYMESIGRRGGRRVMCVLTYNFGNMKPKKKGPEDGQQGGEGGDDGHDHDGGFGGGFGDE